MKKVDNSWWKFTCPKCFLRTDLGGECICSDTELVEKRLYRPDKKETNFESFIKYFPGVKTYQLFLDKKDDRKKQALILHDADPEYLIKMNREGYGIFICVNETDGNGRKKDNIKKVRAVFADLDGADLSPCLQDDAHLVIESSPGKFHCYWFVDDDFPLAGFTAVQVAIKDKYGSDNVIDLPRVLRVPGFYHQKKDPVPVKIYSEKRQPKLSYAECLEKWPQEKKEKWSAPKYHQSSIDEIPVGESTPQLLLRFGWTTHNGRMWTRPGKKSGISGELHEDGLFFCYTSSTCLAPHGQHDAFEIISQYEWGGDKKKAARHFLSLAGKDGKLNKAARADPPAGIHPPGHAVSPCDDNQ